MKTLQIVGAMVGLVGGGIAFYFFDKARDIERANQFWHWNQSTNSETTMMIIGIVVFLIGITLVIVGGLKKKQNSQEG